MSGRLQFSHLNHPTPGHGDTGVHTARPHCHDHAAGGDEAADLQKNKILTVPSQQANALLLAATEL
jgi:hypothetical protein